MNKKIPVAVAAARGFRGERGTDPIRIIARGNTRIDKGRNVDCCSEWLGRIILHESLKSLGLPWVPEAVCRRPRDVWMTEADTLLAVDATSWIVAAMRRRITVSDELRAAAWRCTVAGLERLPREQWPRYRADEPEPPVEAEPQPEPPRNIPPVMRMRKGRHHAA